MSDKSYEQKAIALMHEGLHAQLLSPGIDRIFSWVAEELIRETALRLEAEDLLQRWHKSDENYLDWIEAKDEFLWRTR